jgi:hypothetical protein
VSLGRIARDLTELTRYLHEQCGYEVSGGVLGGRYGYGPQLIDNPLFTFKSFCWCDSPDCPWCASCSCPPEAWTHVLDGKIATPDQVDALYEKLYAARPDQWTDEQAEIDRRLVSTHDPVCDFCLGRGELVRMGGSAGQGAPNFWHKPSGIKIWWYKYLGRGMESQGPLDKWPQALREIYEFCRVIDATDSQVARSASLAQGELPSGQDPAPDRGHDETASRQTDS